MKFKTPPDKEEFELLKSLLPEKLAGWRVSRGGSFLF